MQSLNGETGILVDSETGLARKWIEIGQGQSLARSIVREGPTSRV